MSDPYAAQVVCLLRFTESDGATSFDDECGRTWTAAGGGADIDSGSLLLDGSSYIEAGTGLGDFAFGTGDFTIELWARASSLSPPSFYADLRKYDSNGAYPCIYNDSTGALIYLVNSSAAITSSSGVVSAGVTHHIAYCRSGAAGRLFVDGTQVGSWTDSESYTASDDGVRIGAGNQPTPYPMPGRIYTARITTAARYTSGFSPPSLPLDPLSESSVTGEMAGEVPAIAGDMAGFVPSTGALSGDVAGIVGSMAGESGVIGAADGDLPSIAGDFPGGQGFFAALAGDLVGIAGEMPGLVSQAGEMVGDLPLIAGEFIGGYSVAGAAAGELPLIAGIFAGFTSVASTLDGNLPLIDGSFAGGMATVAAMAGDLPSIAGAFNDGPVAVISGGIGLPTGTVAGYVGTAAAGRWLYLHTTPPAQIYATDAIRGRLRPDLPSHRARFDVTATAAQIGAQNDSFSVTLSGIGSALRERLATQAPYGVRVDVMDGGTVSRTGIVSDFAVMADGSLDLDCESAGWTTPLPLRTNADLGVFRDVQPLPWRYGRAVPGSCIRLGPSGKLWLWADHASERISSVQVDGQDYGAWQWRNDVDAGGNPITVITTADEIDEGAELVATGDGMRDSQSGALIVNPADVVLDVCRRAGYAITRGDLVEFRAECLARGLEVSGSIDSGTLQQTMVSLADSVHAVFARELPGLMRLHPRATAAVVIPARDTPTARASRDAIATRLRIRYALEDGRPRASLEVRAPGVEVLRGVSSADVTLPWVRDARVAADVATRLLADRSRVSYIIPCADQSRRIVPGSVASVTVAKLGLSGDATITASRIDEDGSTPTMLLRIGAAPTITIAAQSSAYTPDQYTGATVATTGDTRQITITGPDGRPIVGARCTLDGSIVRTSNSAGVVEYPASVMPRGPHTILVEQAGMNPITITVVVP